MKLLRKVCGIASRQARGGLLLAALWLTGAVWPSAAAEVRAIRAARWQDVTGQLRPLHALVLRDGKIANVIAAQESSAVPAGAVSDEYGDAVVTSGLIDAFGALSAFGQLRDTHAALTPDHSAADAFDRYSSYLRPALAAGVTTFALAPEPTNVIAGRLALCQTGGPDGRARLLSADGPLLISLAPPAFLPEREPTSRSGALALLRRTLRTAKERPADEPLGSLAQGKQAGVFVAPSGADVLSAIELADEFGLTLVLAHTNDARDVADLLSVARREKSKGVIKGVLVGPLHLGSSQRQIEAAAEFHRRGVPVALVGGLPVQAHESLRLAAALAVRGGLPASAGRLAITATPADLLGLHGQSAQSATAAATALSGRLREGGAADVVVWSGDPLDLRSRVLAVYIGGVRVFVAAPSAAPGSSD